MRAKPDKTPADYMAIAICPALIMVLVGSLVFFLLQVGYAGRDLNRLRWTLFWFVFAMVLVSRIAIEKSPGAAFAYGLALAAVTSVMLTQYIGFLWGVWLLLGAIWWMSNRVVFDCTLIDEDQDASGQGLLQLSRLQRGFHGLQAQVHAVPSSTPEMTREAELANVPVAKPPLPKFPPGVRTKPTKRATARKKKQEVHAPGLWVLYFSIAAIPIFGLGELLLNPLDVQERYLSFGFLVAYLTSALVLLLLTSFLGLRRYLRQRFLIMPGAVAGTWVTSGAGIAILVLILGLLLPRPNTPYSMAGVVTRLSSRSQDEGDSGSEQGSDRNARDQMSSEDQQKESGSDPQTQASRKQSSGGSSGQGKINTSAPPVPVSGGSLFKWLPYLVALILLAFAVFRFAPEIRAGLKALRAWLTSLRLPKSKRARAIGSTPGATHLEVRLLSDPFQTGQAARMSLADLVCYSFTGLKMWASARGFTPEPSETPLEYAERLSKHMPALTHEARLLSSYYSHVVYANQPPPEESLPVLKSLWLIIGFAKGR